MSVFFLFQYFVTAAGHLTKSVLIFIFKNSFLGQTNVGVYMIIRLAGKKKEDSSSPEETIENNLQ